MVIEVGDAVIFSWDRPHDPPWIFTEYRDGMYWGECAGHKSWVTFEQLQNHVVRRWRPPALSCATEHQWRLPPGACTCSRRAVAHLGCPSARGLPCPSRTDEDVNPY